MVMETAIERWRSERMSRMAELYAMHDVVSSPTVDAGPVAVEQLRRMLVVALAAEWQGFLRDLHDEAVDQIVAAIVQQEGGSLGELLRDSLTRRRRLDRGNADQSALSGDFARVGLDDLWATLDHRVPSTRDLRRALADAMSARNAVAHGSEAQLEVLAQRGTTVDVDSVREWQTALTTLATMINGLVIERVGTLTREAGR